MRLFVCWTTRNVSFPPGQDHSCWKAHDALKSAGHDPDVVHALSFGGIPGVLQTPPRREVKKHTGSYWVPALETEDGEWISGSDEIVAWAESHPA
jgi:Glutathione S-transferase, N-terminal domain